MPPGPKLMTGPKIGSRVIVIMMPGRVRPVACRLFCAGVVCGPYGIWKARSTSLVSALLGEKRRSARACRMM